MLKNLQKIGLKFFVEKPCSIDVREFVPIFHSWIQNSTLKDLMIDVADYAHVETGPGVVLIAHEANYAMDLGENRLGLLYYRKQPIESDFPAILRSSFSSALHACRLLETDNKLQGRLQF
ncbi:MAG: hypothetical protein HYU36_22100, partial [Planctomycetes bacterium]|nr:hypothetical protein [Planctomycetota bacterium]